METAEVNKYDLPDGACLRESLRILIRALGLVDKEEAACCSMTLGQCHAIVEIGRARQITVNQLAAMLGLDKSTISRLVDKQVQDGLLMRQENPQDRRYNTLTLSQAGEFVFQGIEQKMTAYFAGILQAVPAEKRNQIVESLALLTAAIANDPPLLMEGEEC